MGWIAFAILAALGIVLQTSVVPHLDIRGVYPDLLLVIAIFYILCAPRLDACIAAWFLGLATDLASHGNVGPMAFAYGAMALLLVRLREFLVRDHPLTHLFLSLLMAWVVQVWAHTYDAICYAPGGRWFSGSMLVDSLSAAAYTAAVAPYVIWLLIQSRSWLGMQAGFRHLRPPRSRRRLR
jgi:rod shape-determining protein MreD